MMRTFWLATICLAVLSALAVGKAVRTIIAERPTDQTTVGTGLAQDALSKAERLEINYVTRNEILQPAVPPTESVVPAVSSVPPPVETKIISRQSHDPHAISPSAAKPNKQTDRHQQESKTIDRKTRLSRRWF